MRTVHVDRYYTSMDRLLQVFDQEARTLPCRTESQEAYQEWRKQVRAKLSELTGMSLMQRCALTPKRLESVKLEGITREKWIIQTEQDVWMPFYVLIPDEPKEKKPCMIATHGHESGGKLSVSGGRIFRLFRIKYRSTTMITD